MKGGTDRLGKVRYVVDYVNRKFSSFYTLEQDIAIDESLVKFRGRLSFVQFNPSKRARFGMEYYTMCESSSGYCQQFRLYTGKEVGDSKLPSHEAIVMELMAPYLSKGYTVHVDNRYSSPTLFHRLLEAGTNVMGAVRLNRKQMPQDLKNMKLKKGESVARYSHKMMAIKWQDKKPVPLPSTIHDSVGMTSTKKTNRKTGEVITKPKSVVDYNKGMGGVDKMDQQLAPYPPMRCYIKGYKKIFFYILDMAFFNSYILYKKITKRQMKYNQCRVTIAEQLIEEAEMPSYARRGRPSAESDMRLQAGYWAHFP
jgi:hypothetical protein